MTLNVSMRDADGQPVCPICGESVALIGQFCSPACYSHFVIAVQDQIVVVEDSIDIERQPWHTQ